MKRSWGLLCAGLLCLAVTSASVRADVIAFEDFEDSTLTYTGPADVFDGLANNDYYGRLGGGNPTPPANVVYNNLQGTGYYGVQDTDGFWIDPENDDPVERQIPTVELFWTGINITDFENLNLSWLVAEDDADDGNQDWDTDASFRIAIQLDGGGFTDIFAIESEIGTDGNQTNEAPRVDTNFDGIGDGAEITDVFTQFSSAIANGTTLDIRVTFDNLNAGEEDLAFDNLLLEGDFVGAIPEPGSALMFSMVLAGLASRRRRRGR